MYTVRIYIYIYIYIHIYIYTVGMKNRVYGVSLIDVDGIYMIITVISRVMERPVLRMIMSVQ
jgi:hypothetical protein